eukprot:GSChrysophyteH1.ASY1.ANO1.1458.1 assembled CDS
MADYDNQDNSNAIKDVFRVGDSVEANKGPDMWLKGTIAACNSDGSFDVEYGDGELETQKNARDIRLIGLDVAPVEVIDASPKPSSKFGDPKELVPERTSTEKISSSPLVNPTANSVSASHEPEIHVVSDEEIRELSRNTTEDRNIGTAKASMEVSDDRNREPLNVENENMITGATTVEDPDVVIDEEDYTDDSSDEDFPDEDAGRKPYQSSLTKPVIKSGGTTISLSQGKLFGILDSSGKPTSRAKASAPLDPDESIKKTLNRIDKLTEVKKKDLSCIRTEDDIELSIKIGTSKAARSAMENCGYDFVEDPKPKDVTDVMTKIAEEDYAVSKNKLGCPICKKFQSFDEYIERKRICSSCSKPGKDVRYVKLNVCDGIGFERRMRDAEKKRQERMLKATKEAYPEPKFTAKKRPQDRMVALKEEMIELFLSVFELRQPDLHYQNDEDLPLFKAVRILRSSPDFLVLTKKKQAEMTSQAFVSLLEGDDLFSKFIKQDPSTRKKVLTDWRESHNDITRGIIVPSMGDQSLPGSIPSNESKTERMRRQLADRLDMKSKESSSSSRIKAAHQLEVPQRFDEDTKAPSKESKEQAVLLKQLAALNQQKAELLSETMALAEQRKRESKDFLEATQVTMDARESKRSNGSGLGSAHSRRAESKQSGSSRDSHQYAESKSKEKASLTRKGPKSTQASMKSTESGKDKFDAMAIY